MTSLSAADISGQHPPPRLRNSHIAQHATGPLASLDSSAGAMILAPSEDSEEHATSVVPSYLENPSGGFALLPTPLSSTQHAVLGTLRRNESMTSLSAVDSLAGTTLVGVAQSIVSSSGQHPPPRLRSLHIPTLPAQENAVEVAEEMVGEMAGEQATQSAPPEGQMQPASEPLLQRDGQPDVQLDVHCNSNNVQPDSVEAELARLGRMLPSPPHEHAGGDVPVDSAMSVVSSSGGHAPRIIRRSESQPVF